MKIGFASDHGGYALREFLIDHLREWGYEVLDFGDIQLNHQQAQFQPEPRFQRRLEKIAALQRLTPGEKAR